MTSRLPGKFKLHCPRVDDAWDIAAPLIQKALDRGSNYSLDDIYKGLKTNDMQLWMWGDEAALVTTLQNRDGKRWCLFLALGGEHLNDWIGFLPVVEGWAKSEGCDEMRIYGRAGWARHIGYDIEYTKMVRKL